MWDILFVHVWKGLFLTRLTTVLHIWERKGWRENMGLLLSSFQVSLVKKEKKSGNERNSCCCIFPPEKKKVERKSPTLAQGPVPRRSLWKPWADIFGNRPFSDWVQKAQGARNEPHFPPTYFSTLLHSRFFFSHLVSDLPSFSSYFVRIGQS